MCACLPAHASVGWSLGQAGSMQPNSKRISCVTRCIFASGGLKVEGSGRDGAADWTLFLHRSLRIFGSGARKVVAAVVTGGGGHDSGAVLTLFLHLSFSTFGSGARKVAAAVVTGRAG